MALKSNLIPQMKTLCNSVAELVNFGISVRNALFELYLIMTFSSWLNKLCLTSVMLEALNPLSN